MSTVSSKRYAQAVFEIAIDRNELDTWKSDLDRIAELARDTEFAGMVENPKIAYDLKTKLVSEKLGGINPLALNLAYLLTAKGKTKIAADIAKDYTRLMNNYRGIKHAEVITAVPIDEEGKERLSDQLGNLVGMKVSVDVKTDPDIMGGIIARIDDALIDGSIRNRLELLKKDLRGRG